jgi:hypothetical protein
MVMDNGLLREFCGEVTGVCGDAAWSGWCRGRICGISCGRKEPGGLVCASESGFPDSDVRINQNLGAGMRFVPVWRPASAHRARDCQPPERHHHKTRGRAHHLAVVVRLPPPVVVLPGPTWRQGGVLLVRGAGHGPDGGTGPGHVENAHLVPSWLLTELLPRNERGAADGTGRRPGCGK